LDQAERLYRQALELKPDHVPALCNRGAALRDLGRTNEALASYDAALALQPDHVWSLNNRGVALIDLGRPQEALASFERALALKPDYPEAHNNRGKALASLDPAPDPAMILASYERALGLKPDHAEAWDNKGVLLAELGRLEDAAAAFEQAIRFAPRSVRFRYHLAEVRRMQPSDPQLTALKAMAANPEALGPDERIELHFTLAKALGDIGDNAEAFRHLKTGADLRRARLPYDEAATLDDLARTADAFPPERMAGPKGGPSDVPIFIVGMPRSGTTLIEQILASVPGVFAAGETNAFANALAARALPDPSAPMSQEAHQALGADYLERIRAAAPDAARITNKRPDNFRVLGLIHLALPNARIIHARRDPMDTCMSCYAKLFGPEFGYSFDLGELGRYYRAYEALMDHWRAVLPQGVMLEVQYEELVRDLEGQARRMLAHCGLAWDPGCLDFHLTERRIRTASAAQVRRPIYTSSIGRWRAYEAELEPLLEALGGA
jgi:tetratricopeptide (TPR) repeat protein